MLLCACASRDRRGGESDTPVAVDPAHLPVEASDREDNRGPEFTSSPVLHAREMETYTYRATAVDPDGDALLVTVDEGPAGLFVDADGLVTWRVENGQAGTYAVRLLASDGLIETTQEFDLVVEAVNLPPQIVSLPVRCPGEAGSYEYAVEAIDDDGDPLTIELARAPPGMTVDETTLRWPSPAGTSAHAVELVVSDGQGGEARQAFRVGTPGAPSGLASARIDMPTTGVELTEPAEITGAVVAPLFHELRFVRHPDGDPVVIHASETPPVGERLGTLPVSSIRNGVYTVELSAYDESCQAQRATVDVTVRGGAKLGPQRLEYIDLEVTTGDLALRVERVYDSTDAAAGDFGIGWDMVQSGLRIELADDPSTGWTQVGNVLGGYAIDGEPRRVVLDSTEEPRPEFVFIPELVSPSDPRWVQGRYEDMTGMGLELECLECDELYFDGTSLLTQDFAPFQPSRFRMRTADGLTFDFERGGRVSRVADRFGAFIEISDAAIVHHSGVRIRIVRDEATGLVTAVEGPVADQRVVYSYDDRRRLTQVRYGDGSGYDYSYEQHRIVRVRNALGETERSVGYDDQGRTAVETLAGVETSYLYDTEARTKHTIRSDGTETIARYDAYGAVLEESDSLGRSVGYEYDTDGRPTATVLADGAREERTWDEQHRVVRERVEGEDVEYSYGAFGQLTRVGSSDGSFVAAQLDDRGLPLTIEASTGATRTMQYDALGHAIRETRSGGCDIAREFDGAGRLTGLHEGGDTLGMVYDEAGRIVRAESEKGTLAFTYDGRGRLRTTTYADGSIEERRYDLAGRLVHMRGADGEVDYAYDTFGRLALSRYSDGTSERRAYDARGALIVETARTGGVTRHEYDREGRRIATVAPDGRRSTTLYDVRDHAVEQVGGAGDATASQFEGDIPVARTDADGVGYAVDYEVSRQRVMRGLVEQAGAKSIRYADGTQVGFAYDGARRPTTVIAPDGSERHAEYDDLRAVTTIVDEELRRTAKTADCAGRVVQTTLPDGETVLYEWQRDALAAVTDGEGHTTRYGYLPGGRLESVTLPTGKRRTLEYDGPRVVRSTDFDGAVTSFEYDALGRQTTQRYADGSSTEWTHGPAGPIEIRDEHGEYGVRYDSSGRPTSVTYPAGGALGYVWDGDGRVVERHHTGHVERRSLTPAGRLAGVSLGTLGVTVERGPLGEPRAVRYAHGAAVEYSFDVNGRVSTIRFVDRDGNERSLRYTYDRSGRVIERVERDATVHYTYTASGHLASERRTGLHPYVREYEYDRVGNRIALVADGARTSYVFDANGWLVRADGPEGSTEYRYDGAGRLIASDGPGGRREYSYGPRGLLDRAETPQGTVELEWDGFGRLAAVTVDGARTPYLTAPHEYAPRALAVGERALAWADDIGVVGASDGSAPLLDGMGSAIGAFDGSGRFAASRVTTAFGERIADEGAAFPGVGFHGQPQPIAELAIMGRRVYLPELGRFTAMDAAIPSPDRPFSENRYLYAANNPLTFADVTGDDWSIHGILGGIAVVGGLIAAGLRHLSKVRHAAKLAALRRVFRQWHVRPELLTAKRIIELQDEVLGACPTAQGPCSAVFALIHLDRLALTAEQRAEYARKMMRHFLDDATFTGGGGATRDTLEKALKEVDAVIVDRPWPASVRATGDAGRQQATREALQSMGEGHYYVRVTDDATEAHALYAIVEPGGKVHLANWVPYRTNASGVVEEIAWTHIVAYPIKPAP